MRQTIKTDERGMAAIFVSFIIIIILSLIVTAFANIIRREQRQTLDRKLSSRAFYAAESGVNLAINALSSGQYVTTGKAECAADAAAPLITESDYILEGAATPATEDDTRVSCLTINTAPLRLEYPNILTGQSRVIPIYSGNGSPVNSLNLSWDSNNSSATCQPSDVGDFPAFSDWNCNQPLLRVDLVNVSGNFTKSQLPDRTLTVFFYPTNNNSGTTVSAAGLPKSATVIGVPCQNLGSNPRYCNATIDGLTGQFYSMRVSAMYQNASLTICSNGCTLPLRGAQAIIDSSGRAVDVVRRVQVRKSLTSTTFVPNGAFESGTGLCKVYEVTPGATNPISTDATTDITDENTPCGGLSP